MFSPKYVAEAFTRRKDLFTTYFLSLVADDHEHDEEEEAPAEADVPPAPMSADEARHAMSLDLATYGAGSQAGWYSTAAGLTYLDADFDFS